MQCPKCKSERFIKDGIVKSKQRHKCKTCNFRYTVTKKSTEKPLYLKRFALQLYLEGLGFRSIGRVLKVSNVSILNWIRQFGEQVKSLQSDEPASITEIDEMHTYIGTKKYKWIWIAVNRYEKRFINFVIGDRSATTGKRLWLNIKEQSYGKIATDLWKPYEYFVPKSQHIQSKSQTFTVEGYNSLFRHFLARLRRKTKCYSKMLYMLELSILLLMHYRNNTLAILN
ncbi:MAG: IS1 family transposase [Candidatus Scalinduaceae bacterium]